MSRSTPLRTVASVATALLSLAVLAGCAADADTSRGIATLTSDAPTAPADASALTAKYGEVPRLRIDMTDAENEAAYGPYTACMADLTGGSPKSASADDQAVASDTCAPLDPKPPWELDRSNPDAIAFVQKVVDCLKGKGVQFVAISADSGDGRVNVEFGGDDNDPESIRLGLDNYDECQREASAG